MEEEKYTIADFIYWIEKYHPFDEIHNKKYNQAEIAQIIARAMVDFFPDTNTPY